MTRLTNEIRDNMLSRIMHGLPNIDYGAQIKALVQDTIIEFAPEEVQKLYANEELRQHLAEYYVDIRDGNGYRSQIYAHFYGLKRGLSLQMDERAEHILKEGTLRHALYTRLRDSNLLTKRKEQEELRDKVRARLKANLAAARTIKRLYDILEPELHGYIPVDVADKSNLPACVAPVVDDLRKLGAVLPETPKASPAEVTQ